MLMRLGARATVKTEERAGLFHFGEKFRKGSCELHDFWPQERGFEEWGSFALSQQLQAALGHLS